MAMATTITDVARLVNRLRIDGFCTTVTMGDDDCIPSGRCAVGGYEWEMCVYPARTAGSPGGKKWVAPCLALLSQPRTPLVRANLSCQAVHPSYEILRKKESGAFRRPKDCTPFVYLVSVSDVENAGYLTRDALTVECTITVLKESPVPTSPAKEMPVLSSNLHQNLGDLLQTEMGADVTFLVSGEPFAAHKNILAARSPVFKAQFFGEMKKLSHRVEVEGMEATIFKAMLHFIYNDTVPDFDAQVLEAVAAMAMAQHLLVAADRYGLDRLKTICENKLSSGITVDTAATTLALAEQHNCSQLKASCVEFMVSTAEVLDVVLATEGYKDLAGSCSSVLSDLLKSARGINN